MHVVLTPSWYPTHQRPTHGTFFREQAHALKAAGLRVGVIAPQCRSLRYLAKSPFGWPKGIEHWDDDGVSTWFYHGWCIWSPHSNGNMRQYCSAGLDVFERYVAAHGKPDLIHAHCALYGGALAAQLKQRYGIPYVLTEHSTSFARNLLSSRKLALVREVMALADARIAVSPQLASLLEERFGDAAVPCRWVPNLVDDHFQPVESTSADRGPSRFRFLNVGFLMAKKGQADLIEAMALAFRNDPSAELRIGGAGPCGRQLKRLARRLGIQDRVQFLGALDRRGVLAQMQACDCFVLSSHYETFGVVVIEALACGKPVIATRCGGPECIVHDGNGLLAPPRNVPALADAMLQMRAGGNRYAAKSIRRDCLTRFSGEAVSRQLIAVFRGAMQGNRAA